MAVKKLPNIDPSLRTALERMNLARSPPNSVNEIKFRAIVIDKTSAFLAWTHLSPRQNMTEHLVKEKTK
jgi:hypothetical protein